MKKCPNCSLECSDCAIRCNCGFDFALIRDSPRSGASPAEPALICLGGKTEVIITDIKMPFWSMVFFMVKWALAAIPAFVILMIPVVIVWSIALVKLMAALGAEGIINTK